MKRSAADDNIDIPQEPQRKKARDKGKDASDTEGSSGEGRRKTEIYDIEVAMKDCPYDNGMHYGSQGCPSCYEAKAKMLENIAKHSANKKAEMADLEHERVVAYKDIERAMKACPYDEPLHWHRDGCPACCETKAKLHENIAKHSTNKKAERAVEEAKFDVEMAKLERERVVANKDISTAMYELYQKMCGVDEGKDVDEMGTLQSEMADLEHQRYRKNHEFSNALENLYQKARLIGARLEKVEQNSAREGTILALARRYGRFGGEQQKQWLLDQIVRAALGHNKVAYDAWVREHNEEVQSDDEEDKEVFEWTPGVAP